MSSVIKMNEVPCCPTCGKPQEDIAVNYFLSGPHKKEGETTLEECGWCDAPFKMTANHEAGTAKISK